MPIKLSATQKLTLQEHEIALKKSWETNDLFAATVAIKAIQEAFLHQRSHHRVLQAKLYYYEILLNVGRTDEAAQGFEVIAQRVNPGTRAFLECCALLGVCYLRQKKIEEAKEKIRLVIANTKDIKSSVRRSQFYARLVKRVEEECILSQLIGQNQGVLEASDVHSRSIDLVRKSDSELLEQVALSLPSGTQKLVSEVSSYSINLLPISDQKLLPPPAPEIPKTELGKKALAALKRIGWQTFCNKSSGVYKLWSKRIDKVFGEGYFAASIVATLGEWRIGIPQLAAGLVATAMRFGCAEFCAQFKPEGLMIPRGDRS